MAKKGLIAASEFCTYHQVHYTFIESLSEAGLIEVRRMDEAGYIPDTELRKLEKMVRMHQDLEINVAGIEAIYHLLNRMELMQQDMCRLRNRLRRFGENDE